MLFPRLVPDSTLVGLQCFGSASRPAGRFGFGASTPHQKAFLLPADSSALRFRSGLRFRLAASPWAAQPKTVPQNSSSFPLHAGLLCAPRGRRACFPIPCSAPQGSARRSGHLGHSLSPARRVLQVFIAEGAFTKKRKKRRAKCSARTNRTGQAQTAASSIRDSTCAIASSGVREWSHSIAQRA
jgi:hypothetical protein